MTSDGSARTARPRWLRLTVGALAVGVGMFWLVLLFVRFREGAWVHADWAYGQSAWAFDLAAYINAAQRLAEEGSLYAAELVSGTFEPGPTNLYYYAPP